MVVLEWFCVGAVLLCVSLSRRGWQRVFAGRVVIINLPPSRKFEPFGLGDLQYWSKRTYLITASLTPVSRKGSSELQWDPMPGTEQTFRLNWASFGIGERRPDAGPNTPSSLSLTLTLAAPRLWFVKFSDENERNRAMTEMNGVYCSTRPMRISAATPKKTNAFQHPYAAPAPKAIYPIPAYTTPVNTVPPDYDVNNTTLFVGNLDLNVSEEELKQNFMQFGEIVSVKIQAGKGCGFIQFGTRASAEEAIQKMQGKMIGQQVIRVSWGRTPTRQDLPGGWGPQMDPSQWSAYYGYGQGYEAYAYGATQDPSMYAYAAYAQYPQQVEGAQDASAMCVPTMEQREEL
ncbi:RNA-binding domain superfamily [Sesbania bispinosa]|nr:RNA-binding domain superfamily [Sesbania bispinosa]